MKIETVIEVINVLLKETNYKLSFNSETSEILLEKIDIIQEEPAEPETTIPPIEEKPPVYEPPTIEEPVETIPDEQPDEEEQMDDIPVEPPVIPPVIDKPRPAWEVKADKLIADAISMIGKVQYVYSKNSPSTMEFDCSSWTKYLFNKHNIINLYWGARKQSTYGTKINNQKDLRKGDLVFFNSKINREKYPTPGDINRIAHVGIYIGEGKFIHNLSPKYDVVISELSSPNWVPRYETAARVIK